MKKSTKKIVIGFIVILVIVFTLAFVGLSQLEKINIKQVDMRGIKAISTAGFSFGLDLSVDNPGWISVPLENINYNITLRKTGAQIFFGEIGNGSLTSRTITKVPIEAEIKWIPSADLILSMIQDKQVLVDISGVASIRLPFDKKLYLPFTSSLDIKPYLDSLVKQIAPKDVAAAVESLPENIGGVNIKEVAKNLIPQEVMQKEIPQAITDALPPEMKNKTANELLGEAAGFLQGALGEQK